MALACSAELEQYSTDADSGSTHALVSVERSTQLDGQRRATALAGFVRMPADTDANALLSLVGLRHERPAMGQCRSSTAGSAPSPAGLGRVELLEAGSVSLSTASSDSSLAPHAFPTVTDLVSGIVYTTRDRNAEPLPAAVPYTLRASGGAALPALEVVKQAPAELEAVTLGGVPLAEVAEVSVGSPLDFTWGVGASGDTVYVELSSADGTRSTVCAFRDDAGAGTVPAGVFVDVGPGRVSLHRVRVGGFASPGIDVGEVRFDFELASGVSFTP